MKKLRSALILVAVLVSSYAQALKMIGSEPATGLGQEKVRLGVADFKSSGADPRNESLDEDFQRHAVERSGQRRHLRHGFEELLFRWSNPVSQAR